MALDDALTRLAARHARVVELRYLAGLSVEAVAQVVEMFPATVKREWMMARAWRRGELGAA